MSVQALKAHRRLCMLLASVAFLFCGCATRLTLPPTEITLVDATNGRPVADATLVLYVDASTGSFTGHGGSSTNLFLLESASDASGIARFPAQDVGKAEYNLFGPFLIIYAKDYQPGGLPANLFTSKREILEWMNRPKVIRMKPAANDDERADVLRSALGSVTHAVRGKGTCWLRNMPRFLATLEAGVEEWNARAKAAEQSAAASRLREIGTMKDLYRAAEAYRTPICPAE